ncbi:MAG: DNA/RNA non-specific endonuclease [Alistipes sp.]|nr:DNA/RNA non-specific endonuclease [Alistipes sp.]
MYRLLLNMVAKVGVVAMMLLVAAGCDEVSVEQIKSNAYVQTPEVKGESKNCAVVLRAQQGTSFSMTIESEGDWARFSSGLTTAEGTMETTDKIVYVYFSKNASGKSREATVHVSFGDNTSVALSFTQHSYDNSIAFVREWAELPVCKNENDYIFNTHYGTLGLDNNARNYTYCFDPSVRASLWVAYPLHSSHMTGDGNRNNSDFGYDPAVESSMQANLSRSYNGWYDRGHQLPAADRKCSQQMMDQTFYATNMTPQQSQFNQNKWGVLEGRVRNMVCSDTLYVVTGAYFKGQHDSSIDSQTTDRSGNACPTATYYYKALLRTKKGNTGKSISEITDANQLRAIAIWMRHTNSGDDTSLTKEECISIAELEEITGFSFFPMIDDAIEAEVKRTAVPSEWGIN